MSWANKTFTFSKTVKNLINQLNSILGNYESCLNVVKYGYRWISAEDMYSESAGVVGQYTEASLITLPTVVPGNIGGGPYRTFRGTKLAGLIDSTTFGFKVPADAAATTAMTVTIHYSYVGAATAQVAKLYLISDVWTVAAAITLADHAAGNTDNITITDTAATTLLGSDSFTTATVSANQLVTFRLYRDADDAAETETSVVNVHGVEIKYERTI